MAKNPVSGDISISSDQLQTWILKVYIHCEGCKKKVFKVLQSIDGVYKTVIDSKQHKAIVTGSVKGETLVQKLLKSGKHAEILPESFGPPALAKSENETGGQKKKKKQNKNNKQIDQDQDEDEGDENEHAEKEISNDENDTKNDQDIAEPVVLNGNGNGGGKKKKNKNKKGNKDENKPTQKGGTEDIQPNIPPADSGVISENNLPDSIEKFNLDTPRVYTTPYAIPPYHNYYPIPASGMSYNTSYPSTGSSYYTPPVYGYTQSHPSGFNQARPHPSYYGRSAFDDHDDEGGEGRFCAVM